MESKKFMKILVISKLVLVILAFASYKGLITFGDVSLWAEETAPKDGEKLAKADGPNDSTDDSKDDAKDGEEKKAEDDPETKSRKSFLSELFELPKLDTKKARKEEIGKYLDMADRKEKQLKVREEMLARREERLKALEKSIDEKLVKMDEERKFIAKTLQDEKDLKGERLDKLITLYDKMEPKKAAPQIEKLDKDLVVGLFKGLKQKQVTTILESMNPDKSVEIAEYFGRVKSGREYDLLKELNSSLKKEFAECKGMPEADAAASKAVTSKDAAKKDPTTETKPNETKPEVKEAH